MGSDGFRSWRFVPEGRGMCWAHVWVSEECASQPWGKAKRTNQDGENPP